MRVFPALAFAMICPLPFASTQTAPAGSTPPAAATSAPAVAMTTYRNDTLHLSYSYPASFTDASAMAGPALEASMSHEAGGGKDLSRCITLPFSAMSSAGGLSVVLLVRADAGCKKKSYTAAQLPEFTRGEVQGLTASGARTQFGEPIAFTTGGRPAELLKGTFSVPAGQTLQAMATCVLVKPDIVCWQFIASAEESLHTMSAFPVSFEGGTASPLVPAGILAKP